MSKTWAERIAEAKGRGKFTQRDCGDLGTWHTCLVAEALSEAKAPAEATYLVSREPCDRKLFLLGGGHEVPPPETPAGMARANRFDAVEQRRLAIRARVAELYGPSDESLIAATVEAAKKHAAEPELAEV